MKKVHFIGIGGIGISAIARMMLLEGDQITGSDQTPSLVTEELEKVGAKVFIGQKAENLPADLDLVVYTIAIGEDNPELVEAKRRGIKCLSYPEMLGQISADKYTIAVAGTHGKTTTTAMIAAIMLEAKLDPTVIIGSFLLKADGSRTNFVSGQSKYLVVEACEYRRSFLNLAPKILVITNIDNDHLDYYKDLADIKSAFAELAAKAEIVITEKEYLQIPTTNLQLLIPGAHNVSNAKAALAVANVLGISPALAIEALNKFKGTWRRFEYKGQTKNGALVYDDYAHHPTEIRATLAAARELYPEQRLIVVFEPHLYSRTKLLFKEFSQSFAEADELFLAPIYAAREAFDPSVSLEQLAEVTSTRSGHQPRVVRMTELPTQLELLARAGDIVITMGAGEIYKVAGPIALSSAGR